MQALGLTNQLDVLFRCFLCSLDVTQKSHQRKIEATGSIDSIVVHATAKFTDVIFHYRNSSSQVGGSSSS
jgi:hypothetical protein